MKFEQQIRLRRWFDFALEGCHPLTGDRNGQFAVDLVHPYRLVFEKNGEEIQIANIIEIVDYH